MNPPSPASLPPPEPFSGPLPDLARKAIGTIDELGPPEIRRRRRRLLQSMEEVGYHYTLPAELEPREPLLAPDLLPLPLEADTWSLLSRGVSQRIRAGNALVRDLYGPQKIIKDRIIPHSVVFQDPSFLREIARLPRSPAPPVFLGAVDVVPLEDGSWKILENHFALPFGLAHLLQNRRLLSRTMPELFVEADIETVSHFPAAVTEALGQFTKASNPHTVLLTNDDSRQAFFEESFLARRLGIPIVKPSDLIVRQSHLYLKTVGGLRQVDIVFRRVRGTSLDPVSIASTGMDGIPGLLSCLRQGNVTILNDPGSGVADNKGLLRHSDQIIRYYLHEKPLLGTLSTYHGRDADQADLIRRQERRMKVDLVQSMPLMRGYARDILNRDLPEKPIGILRTDPHWVVGQTLPRLSQFPRLGHRGWTQRPFFLRLFGLSLSDDRIHILPGALGVQGNRRGPWWNLRMDLHSGGKDVWIPRHPNPDFSAARHRRPPPLQDYHLGSRAAESLYWLGRYMERAENLARRLNVLEEIRWEELGRADQAIYWPLWKAIAEATGQKNWSRRRKPPRDTLPLSRRLLLEREDPSSLFSCLESALRNARQVREATSPEMWTVLTHLVGRLGKARRRSHQLNRDNIRQIGQEVVEQCSQFMGIANRTMTHNEGWDFFLIGLLLERLTGIIPLLNEVLTHACRVSIDAEEENPDLTALLRILGSLDVYRREYRSRAYLDQVAELLWKSLDAPYSVAYGLTRIAGHINRILNRTGSPGNHPLPAFMETSIQQIEEIPLSRIFPFIIEDPETPFTITNPLTRHMESAIKRVSDQMETMGQTLHQKLEDQFFAHQQGIEKEG